MSELPSGWARGSLGDVLRIRNGYAFKSAEFKLEGIPLVRQSNLDGDKVDLSKCVFLDEQYLIDRPGFTLHKGDVLIGMSGSVGKLCTYDQNFAALQNQRVGKVELHAPDQTEWRFIWHYLKTVTDALLDKAKGVAVANVSPDDIHSLPLNIPPLAEQTRIAQKLDELLAQVDTLKARIDAIPTLLKRFRQSVLAAAVSGRLTEEWRALNPSISPISADDLKNAWTDVYRLQGKKYKEVDLFPGELGYPLPASWLEAKIGEVFDVYVGATPSRENPVFWGGDIPWVSSSEVAFCHIKETRESITETGYKSASTTIHPAGTVMLAMIGQGKTRGQPAILDIDACHNQNTAAIRVHPNYCISEFLYYYLYERYEETRRVGSGNNQQALNKKAVQSLPFPLPPLAEQTEIVRRVEQLFVFADQLEAKVASAKSRIDHLTQSILAKAFRGELVPQDPNDEPASVLLDRIQAQRAAAPKAKAKRGRKTSA